KTLFESIEMSVERYWYSSNANNLPSVMPKWLIVRNSPGPLPLLPIVPQNVPLMSYLLMWLNALSETKTLLSETTIWYGPPKTTLGSPKVVTLIKVSISVSTAKWGSALSSDEHPIQIKIIVATK